MSPEPTAAIAAPESPAVAGSRAESLDTGPPGGPNSVAAEVRGPNEETAASKLAEKSEVAPPPPLAPKTMLAEVAPPPERATLLPIPSAAPCPPVAASAVPQKQTVETLAVAGPENIDDEAVAVSGLEDTVVAAEMNKFVVELQKDRSYVGISAFLIFALNYRVRVCVWYGTRSEDIVHLRTMGHRCY